MRKDIENRADIELLVNVFYESVRADKLLGPIFSDIAKVNWQTHLPKMVSFWENIILHSGNFEGNPMNLHKKLDDLTPLTEIHFNQWNKLFKATINTLFSGERVESAIADTMHISDIIRKMLFEYQQKK